MVAVGFSPRIRSGGMKGYVAERRLTLAQRAQGLFLTRAWTIMGSAPSIREGPAVQPRATTEDPWNRSDDFRLNKADELHNLVNAQKSDHR